jgi:hypothetical protein
MDYRGFETFVFSSTRKYVKPYTIFCVWNDIETIPTLKSDGVELMDLLTRHFKDKIVEEEIETIALYIKQDGII